MIILLFLFSHLDVSLIILTVCKPHAYNYNMMSLCFVLFFKKCLMIIVLARDLPASVSSVVTKDMCYHLRLLKTFLVWFCFSRQEFLCVDLSVLKLVL